VKSVQRMRWVLSAGLCVFFTGCHCRVESPSGAWEFEDDCVDERCGFTGPEDQVYRTGTLVAGEHGLALTSGATAVREESAPWRTATVSMVGWCERSGVVSVTLFTRTENSSETVRVRFSLNENWQLVQGSGSTPIPTPESVVSVVIVNQTEGLCVFDQILVGDPGDICVF
jgi:hypothetical protein